MRFVDEATIKAIAGDGGNGVIHLHREKFVPRGGPDGGDGGDGGSIFLVGDNNINTLVDFRTVRTYLADNGEKGGAREMTGKKGEDLYIKVPIGTLIFDDDTDELIGDITGHFQRIKVCQGGWHGLGNARFKSSTNRAPRKCTPGTPGERRNLRLELKVLADVGLLGMPNAGKSTLIRAVSAARPKVANYPFTTLHPNLGVVRVGDSQSFVIADIPGLIEGASEGAGLGIQFLKHLTRTSLLLHMIDVAPIDGTDPVDSAVKILNELEGFSAELLHKPRWLVLNKTDLLDDAAVEEVKQGILDALNWEGPVYAVSAVSKAGTQQLVYDIMQSIQIEAEPEIEENEVYDPTKS